MVFSMNILQTIELKKYYGTKPNITRALDSMTSSDVLSLMKVTSYKFHQTLVMITHNNDITHLADRIIRIEDGKIMQQRRWQDE